MRDFATTLGGKKLTLAATFRASVKIATQVGDPLMIAREAALEEEMRGVGLTYNTKWAFTIENVCQIIHIGLETAGDKMPLSDVQELVFDAGFIPAREVAASYLAMIVTPDADLSSIRSDKASEDSEKK